MVDNERTTIQIKVSNKLHLDTLKLVGRESYDSVIERLLKEAMKNEKK